MRWLTLLTVPLVALTMPAADEPANKLVVDKTAQTITIPAKVAPRKLPNLAEIYPIEVVACFSAPKGKKAHETVFVIDDVKPSEVHQALESLGLKPGSPAIGEEKGPASGPALNVFVDLPTPEGNKKVPIHQVLVDKTTQKPLPKSVKFLFTGSVQTQPDPDKPEKVYGADVTGTFIAVYPVTAETVLQTSLTMKEEKLIKLDANAKLLPKEGTAVKLILEVAK
jgi:hypothetical protein